MRSSNVVFDPHKTQTRTRYHSNPIRSIRRKRMNECMHRLFTLDVRLRLCLLSLPLGHNTEPCSQIVVTQSDGALAIWRPHPNGGAPIQEVAPWRAHTLRGGIPTEAWISFFKRHGSGSGCAAEAEGSFVVSGADDALMKGWDLRVGGGGGGASPAFVCKGHGAGVTAGQWHPTLEHTFARYAATRSFLSICT